jgi:3-oxoacyl-[acyl-carrier protein] reductase
MDLELEGKVAVITGGSRGLGYGIASALAREGCEIAICARGEDDLREAAEAIEREHGREVLALPLDVTEPDAGERLIAAAEERFGGVDILVANAGGNRRKPFAETTDEDWTHILDLNLRHAERASRAAIPRMRKRGGGAIVFISSIWGRESAPPGQHLSLYVTTKAALIALAKQMAGELAPEGIRVNSIAPGSIRFPGGSWDQRVKEDPEGMEEFVRENLPLGRFGTREELADFVACLVSPRASLLTGACVPVDGGQGHTF